MARNKSIQPKDLVSIVCERLDQTPGDWVSPKAIWDHIRTTDPGLAGQVQEKIRSYQNPTRNNEVWFVSNTLSHVDAVGSYEVSDIEKVPHMKGESVWLVARAVSA